MSGNILYVPAGNLRNPIQTEYLVAEGFVFHHIRHGEERVARQWSSEPCVILLEMEVFDLEFIRKAPQFRAVLDAYRIPILALVGPSRLPLSHEAIRHEAEALDSGIDAYLQKPISFTRLVARLRVLLRRTPTPYNPLFSCQHAHTVQR
ncbi:MAG: response regulator transcription factor [Bacteroidetes Order II. Incertae sedis bacterium]|nr:response regulator transcription factor [Bacteroidetes Order II. bacterium]